MSDTWKDIQELKNKQSSLREKLKSKRQKSATMLQSLAAASTGVVGSTPVVNLLNTSKPISKSSSTDSLKRSAKFIEGQKEESITDQSPAKLIHKDDLYNKSNNAANESIIVDLLELERLMLKQLDLAGISMDLPLSVKAFQTIVEKELKEKVLDDKQFDDLLIKFSFQKLISLETSMVENRSVPAIITNVDHTKLSVFLEDTEKKENGNKESSNKHPLNDIENLLGAQTAKEREIQRMNEEINELLNKPTAKESAMLERFRSQGGSQVQQFCPFGTREECLKMKMFNGVCTKLHFRKIIQAHTDESLGDCSFLNTCFHIESCKYVHYEIEQALSTNKEDDNDQKAFLANSGTGSSLKSSVCLYPPQWIDCDVRQLDMSVLGKFAVIMADPPWDIHMELPYGTMSDDEMRKLGIPCLQDEGYMFLWVTGRAMELGRECLKLWGYERCDELIWVKTNQLQRIIRTGRTGHWFNHGKEHCLVGVKGDPKNMTKGLDCDVIVSEVRETSHKPDEIYGIIERLSPGMRKLELFGRPHNVQPNWITLGNQLDGVRLVDPEVVDRFKKRYPNGLEGSKKS